MTAQGYGQVVEEANLDSATRGGQPDFTYRPVHVAKSSGRLREITDGFIWVGERLVLTSSRSRDPSKWDKDGDARRRSWLDKNILRAAGQIPGSWRKLCAATDLELINERGHVVTWSSAFVNPDLLVGVVIVDCPSPAGYVPPTVPGKVSTVVMTREDWALVNRAIMSATGVAKYLRVRAEMGWPVELGRERDALAAVLRAEHDGVAVLEPGGWKRMLAEVPDLIFGKRRDDRYGLVIDTILAGVSDDDPLYTNVSDTYDHLRIAAFLDAIPRLARVEAGKRIMEKCRLAYEQGRERHMVLRTENGPLVFVAHPGDRDERREFLERLTVAVHTRLLDGGADGELVTVGVATEPYPNDGRSHDYMYVRGGFRFTAEERASRDFWLDARTAAPRPIDEAVLSRLDAK